MAQATQAMLSDAFSRIGEVVHKATKGLGEHELAFRPDDKANSIAWLVWHLTRVQDSHISELLNESEVWTSHGWHKKFDLPLAVDETGYGHSSNKVGMVQASESQLIGYYDAVQKRTLEYLSGLKETDYEEIVDPSWDPPVSLRTRLVSIISDDLQHAGQAMYVRGLLD